MVTLTHFNVHITLLGLSVLNLIDFFFFVVVVAIFRDGN